MDRTHVVVLITVFVCIMSEPLNRFEQWSGKMLKGNVVQKRRGTGGVASERPACTRNWTGLLAYYWPTLGYSTSSPRSLAIPNLFVSSIVNSSTIFTMSRCFNEFRNIVSANFLTPVWQYSYPDSSKRIKPKGSPWFAFVANDIITFGFRVKNLCFPTIRFQLGVGQVWDSSKRSCKRSALHGAR